MRRKANRKYKNTFRLPTLALPSSGHKGLHKTSQPFGAPVFDIYIIF